MVRLVGPNGCIFNLPYFWPCSILNSLIICQASFKYDYFCTLDSINSLDSYAFRSFYRCIIPYRENRGSRDFLILMGFKCPIICFLVGFHVFLARLDPLPQLQLPDPYELTLTRIFWDGQCLYQWENK